MKKSLVLGLTATLLTFAPLVAANTSKTAKPASSQVQKQRTSNQTAMSNRIQRLRGTVDSVSPNRLTITTKSGNKDTFILQSSTKKATQVKAGERVTVWYRESNGQMTATRIAVNGTSSRNMGRRTTAANRSSAKANTQHSPMTSHH